MEEVPPRRERSPAIKLLFVGLVSLVLIVPLLLTYALVYDRQDQSQTAQTAINAGWGGPQVLSGPVLVVPFRTTQTQNEVVDGKAVNRVVEVEKLLYVSPIVNRASTRIEPEERRKSIYRSVLFTAQTRGHASFTLPADLARFGVTRERLMWDRAELRIGASDARGLTTGGAISANGKPLEVQPGKGPAASGGQGFFAFLSWDGTGRLEVDYAFGLRGSRTISLVPRGGTTTWEVSSRWPSPSFEGAFLPERPEVTDKGFRASYTVDKLALGQPPVAMEDYGAPQDMGAYGMREAMVPSATSTAAGGAGEVIGGPSRAVSVSLIETVDPLFQG